MTLFIFGPYKKKYGVYFWPFSPLLQHVEAMQGGGDVLGADPRQFAELSYGDLPVAELVETLQHHATPVGHVRQPA